MSLSVEVLNNVRNNADADYQARVPEATRDNIATIGRTFEQYDLVYNTFIDTLIHKIGLVLFHTKSYENKLKRFKRENLTSQQDIEEIFVDQFRVAEGSYDKDGGVGENGIHPFKRRTYQEVRVMYHRMNRQDKYVMTLSKVDVIRAFKSANTLDTFLSAQFNSLFTGSEYDEYVHMKKLLGETIAEIKADDAKEESTKKMIYYVPKIDGTTANTMSFVRTAKKAIKDMSYPSTDYNLAHIKTFANESELVMFVNKDVAVHMDVDMYAQIFGPNYAKMNITTIELDNFGDDNTGAYALIVDKDFLQVYDTLQEMRQLENPEGLYTNYWLHIWQVLSYSKFKNSVLIAEEQTA